MKMNKDELFEAFKELFPEWAEKVTSYEKIGSKTLAIKFAHFGDTVADKTEKSRVFLFYDYDNWQFGTKLYRKKPIIKSNPKNKKEERNEDKID